MNLPALVSKVQHTYAPRTLTVLCGILSFCFSYLALQALGLGGGSDVLLFALTVVGESSKIIFALKGWALLRSGTVPHQIAGGLLCACVGVLIAGSVLASYHGMRAFRHESRAASVQTSDAERARIEKMDGMRKDLERMELTAMKHRESNYLTASRELEEKIALRRDELYRLSTMRAQDLARIQHVSNMDQHVINVVMAVAALMLEVISIFAITILFIEPVMMSKKEKDELGPLLQQIRDGDLRPGMAALQRAKIKRPVAEQLMKRAQELKIIEMRGKRWVLTAS